MNATLLRSGRDTTESITAAPLTWTAPSTVNGRETTVSVWRSPRLPAAVDVATIAKVRLAGSYAYAPNRPAVAVGQTRMSSRCRLGRRGAAGGGGAGGLT